MSIDDGIFIVGAGLVDLGVFFIYWPLGFITMGAFLIFIAYCLAKRKVKI
jgi:hypothetical protein